TEAGETLLSYARRILALNDEAMTALRGRAVAGEVRFGMPGDFAETWLPEILGRFKRAHPAVRIEARLDPNRGPPDQLDRGELDLALVFGGEERAGSELLAELPTIWIGGAEPASRPGEPVPLAVFDSPCVFRDPGIAALDRAGIAWRIAFTSPGLPG